MAHTTATKLMHGLLPLVAGLLLGAAGWKGATLRPPESLEFQPQLVVRPSSARVLTVEGEPPTADERLAGRFLLQDANLALELRQQGWPSVAAKVTEPRGMTTVRSPVPGATLAVTVKEDKEAKVTLLELPKKRELPSSKKGPIRVEPGRHELLVQAEGYVPKRLSLNLEAGQRKEIAIDLQPIPGVPAGWASTAAQAARARASAAALATAPEAPLPLPSTGQPSPPGGPSPVYRPPSASPPRPAAPPRTAVRPPAYSPPPAYVPPPPPRYEAPPAYEPPQPAARFTPVAPPPQPSAPDPVPMFTPIGN